jgi:hypothetical protein
LRPEIRQKIFIEASLFVDVPNWIRDRSFEELCRRFPEFVGSKQKYDKLIADGENPQNILRIVAAEREPRPAPPANAPAGGRREVVDPDAWLREQEYRTFSKSGAGSDLSRPSN